MKFNFEFFTKGLVREMAVYLFIVVLLLCHKISEENDRWEEYLLNIEQGVDVVVKESSEVKINEYISKMAEYGYFLKENRSDLTEGLLNQRTDIYIFTKRR